MHHSYRKFVNVFSAVSRSDQDLLLLSASTPHPPVASIVEPKYLNDLVHGIAKQTSSLDPAGLKYSVFFLLIISPFPSSTSLQLSSCCSTSISWLLHITFCCYFTTRYVTRTIIRHKARANQFNKRPDDNPIALAYNFPCCLAAAT